MKVSCVETFIGKIVVEINRLSNPPLVSHRECLCRLHLTGELHSLVNSERSLTWTSGDSY